MKSSTTNERLDENELLDFSKEVLDLYKKLVEEIGKERFVIYNDVKLNK